MQSTALRFKAEGKTIGLVPTMGALHEGHLSLIRKARIDANIVVVSIFVNPIQFGPAEDLQKYPRKLVTDLDLCEKERADFVFIPTEEEMYPKGFTTTVEVKGLSDVLCGAYRPGHFKGVTTVVSKLFNIAQPDLAYFGQKDAQQTIIIKRMAADLNMKTNIVVLPIVRDTDGLAMSSRNVYLSQEERKTALVLPKSLKVAESLIRSGERRAEVIKGRMMQLIQTRPGVRLEYIAVCDSEQLQERETVQPGDLIALAAWVGKTRLIDNVIV